jgi:protease-4
MRALPGLPITVSLLVATVFAGPGLAQGLSDPRSGALLPNPQAAAVDDATALFVNPAGLGAVRGFELGAGYANRFLGLGADQVVDGVAAIAGPLGTLAAGASMVFPASGGSRLLTSLGGGLQLDDSVLVGLAMHSLEGAIPTWDLGTQLRLHRAVAVGAVGEGLGSAASSVRAGLSLRPLDELLTIGVDARFKPAPFDDPGQAIIGGAFTPGLHARLRLGGVVIGAGAELQNLGGLGPVSATATALLQIDLDRVGVALQGGAAGIGADVTSSLVGVRGRFSTTAWPSVLPATGRWLELRLAGDGGVVDESDNLWEALFSDPPNALQVLAALDNAVDDDSVEGVLLRFEGLRLGFGTAAELRGAITRLRGAGKKVAVYLVAGEDLDAWIASAADRVWLAPSGGLAVDGVRARMIYLADALGRLGITAEAVSAGRYKSAPRTFTHTEPSPEELEVEAALLDGAYDALVRGLAEGRGRTPEQIKATIDLGGLSAPEALAEGLVDALAYPDEVGGLLAELAGRDRLRTEQKLFDDGPKVERWGGSPRIAVVPVIGTIQMGRARGGLFSDDGAGADDIVDAINKAAADDSVVAIVLRIDSPGGDALASDLIWRAAMLARDKKPVIASMGDVAASGGYYVAAAAHHILAGENTITGSIGVFGLLFNAEGLIGDLGVRSVEQQRGALPGPDLFRGTTDEERARLQQSVDATYERFLEAVVRGRGEEKITKEALREVAEGRVWTGAQALDRKLVDGQGSIIDALRLARERAGLGANEEITLAVFSGKNDLPLLGALGGAVSTALGLPRADRLKVAAHLLFGDPAMAELATSSAGKPLVLAPAMSVR